jgi:hypothetical protein
MSRVPELVQFFEKLGEKDIRDMAEAEVKVEVEGGVVGGGWRRAHQRLRERFVRVQEEMAVDVPQVQVVDLIRQVPYMQIVPKQIEKLTVARVEERIVEKMGVKPISDYFVTDVGIGDPQVICEEQIVEIPEVEVELLAEQELFVKKGALVQKEVAVKVPQLTVARGEEVGIGVPQVICDEKIAEIPEVEVDLEELFVEKGSAWVQEELAVEVTQVQVVDSFKQVPNIQIVPKQIEKTVARVEERVVEKMASKPYTIIEYFEFVGVLQVICVKIAEVLEVEVDWRSCSWRRAPRGCRRSWPSKRRRLDMQIGPKQIEKMGPQRRELVRLFRG